MYLGRVSPCRYELCVYECVLDHLSSLHTYANAVCLVLNDSKIVLLCLCAEPAGHRYYLEKNLNRYELGIGLLCFRVMLSLLFFFIFCIIKLYMLLFYGIEKCNYLRREDFVLTPTM